ncbi:MAG: PQQ-dependent sugar dehydrogenase [Chloroflexota bacterium]|nr:PQQ-dependent sugar dehydrogenase [Chloroflexota bacterium]MDQ5865030.1 PQQ-dependent sugar dehydrogenase [Chloroflexota bacterium]
MALIATVVALVARGDIAQAAPGSPLSPDAQSEPLPPGVVTQTLLTNMNDPVAMAFDPDGRLFYTEKNSGNVRVYANGALQAAIVIHFDVDSANEQGLLGIAIDPNFNTNNYIYVFRSCPLAICNPREHHIIRFVFDENTGQAVSNSATIIYRISNDSACLNHNGGNIHFGPYGKLYITVGDDGCTPQKSQDLSLKHGKILRINSDGTVPNDGPFGSRTDDGKAIWAYGLRNSFDFTFDPVVPGRIFATENGPHCDDELNLIEEGFNYGWRAGYPCDDQKPNPDYNDIRPLWYLGAGSPDPVPCCIAPTGVEVYSGTQISQWTNHLFMCTLKAPGSNYGTGYLYHFYLNGDRTAVTDFRTVAGVNCTMDIESGPDGALYYMEKVVGAGNVGNLVKIVSTANQATNTPGPSNTPGGATPTRTRTAMPSATVPATATPTTSDCEITFQDVPAGSTFYPYITCLACQGIVGGYPCGGPGEPCGTSRDPYYRPGANITRGQISKIVSEAAGFADDPGTQVYEDVEPGSPFYPWINRLSNRGHMSGYPCGGPGEPCEAGNRPYFRPNANATRGQLSKIVANAAGFDEDASGQTYADVPVSSAPSSFYIYIERLSARQVMGGYACGTADPNSGPCDDQDRSYFRPGNLVTRGQAAKIVGNTFYPNCERAVDIRNFAYIPEEVTVEVGTTVRWTNFDLDYHTVTSLEPSGPLDSPAIQQHETWAYTFNAPGEYEYYCEPHPYMRGKVVVTP